MSHYAPIINKKTHLFSTSWWADPRGELNVPHSVPQELTFQTMRWRASEDRQRDSHRREAQTCKRDCVNRGAWRKALREGLGWLCFNSPVDNYVPLCWMRLCPDAIWPARKQWPNFTNHCGVLSVLNTRLDVVGTEEQAETLPSKVQAVLQKSWHWGVGATNLDGCSWDAGLRAGKQQLG